MWTFPHVKNAKHQLSSSFKVRSFFYLCIMVIDLHSWIHLCKQLTGSSCLTVKSCTLSRKLWWGQVSMLSFIGLHVPQSIVQIVNVLDANSLVDFFSAKDRFWSSTHRRIYIIIIKTTKILHAFCRHLHNANTKCMLLSLCHYRLHPHVKGKLIREAI